MGFIEKYPAVPLITVDPFFSVWSNADTLPEAVTVHWTDKRNSMLGLIRIDGKVYRFMGGQDDTVAKITPMEQTGLSLRALTTACTFQQSGVRLTAEFTTPLLLDDVSLMSRPISYVTFKAEATDGAEHEVELYMDVSAQLCVDCPDQTVAGWPGESGSAVYRRMGNIYQQPIDRSGDDHRIDWGYLYLICPDAAWVMKYGPADLREAFADGGYCGASEDFAPLRLGEDMPVASAAIKLNLVGGAVRAWLAVGYDDLLSVEYFYTPLRGYWQKGGMTFAHALKAAVEDYGSVMERCDAFNADFDAKAVKSGGESYKTILCLAYRQAIAAHKAVADGNGNLLFLSKECFSNGCIATVDVTYPSVPLFLLYNPELVRGMLRPVLRYAESAAWSYNFAPHDVGQYPKANGQVYGDNKIEFQMPVEECGNMLICVAAALMCDGNTSFAAAHLSTLRKWADYLAENGFDPESQLCTDDFAGHLARNANLSVKAAMGLAAFAKIESALGDHIDAERYMSIARGMASKWEMRLRDGDHYMLAFDAKNTWSLKYNMIWDILFGTGMFKKETRELETDHYIRMSNCYGIPLDSRADYTKVDWAVWAACLTDNDDKFEKLIAPIERFLQESPSRVPFTDWYDTKTGRQIGFQNRTVLGGVFMKLLKDKLLTNS